MTDQPESADLADIVTAPLDDLEQTGAPSFDSAHFRAVLGHFCTGISIITAIDGNDPVGLTCQSFTSVSLEPAGRVRPGQDIHQLAAHRAIRASSVSTCFSEDQEELCRVFATTGTGKFRGVGWHPGESGSPVIHSVLAGIDCRIETAHEVGDHRIAGRLASGSTSPRAGKPLLFYRGGYGRFEA